MLRKIKLTSAAATPAARESHLAVKYASLLLCGVTLALSVAPASAEEPTVDEMVCALNPQCKKPFVDRPYREFCIRLGRADDGCAQGAR